MTDADRRVTGGTAPAALTLRVLGASGGIGGRRRTSTYLLGERALVEAGTGVADLELEDMARIDDVLVTHAHVDHVVSLPLLVDSVSDRRETPVTLHATKAVLQDLRAHLFNGRLWPDFSRIRLASGEPALRFSEVEVGSPVVVGGASLTAIQANHGVPAIGFVIEGPRGRLVYSGDTAGNPELWAAVEAGGDRCHTIIEVSFPDRFAQLAAISGHLCPARLAEQMRDVHSPEVVHVTHMKPGHEAEIRHELEAHGLTGMAFLDRGQTFDL